MRTSKFSDLGRPGRKGLAVSHFIALLAASVGILSASAAASPPPAYHFSSVSTYAPLDSVTLWTYEGVGCRSLTELEGKNLDHDLHLPSRATIDELRLYYYQVNLASFAYAALYSFDAAGSWELVAEVWGSGASGYSSVAAPAFSHLVDNRNKSLVIRVYLDSANPDLRACGVRVRYQIPPLFADGFESGDTSEWSSSVP